MIAAIRFLLTCYLHPSDRCRSVTRHLYVSHKTNFITCSVFI